MFRYWKQIVVGILVALNIFVWFVIFSEDKKGEMKVSFLDVGQGDAIFIEAPNGNQVLIDSGRDKDVLKDLAAVMPFYDRSIDMIISTHPDADHIGGFPSILDRFRVYSYMYTGSESESAVYRSFVEGLNKEGVEEILARRGMRIILSEGSHLDVLFPDRDVSKLDSNDASLIARLTYGEIDFILTGDASKYTEGLVVAMDGDGLDAEVLKVGHHGSKTSTARSFVAAVSPDFSIISTEENSRYGHPHQEVLDTLSIFDTEILSTADRGTITFVTDGNTLRLD